MIRLPIRVKLALVVSGIILFFGILASIFVFNGTKDVFLTQAKAGFLALGDEQAKVVEEILDQGKNAVQIVSGLSSVKSYVAKPRLSEREAMNVYLEQFSHRYDFSAVYVLTATGSAVASTDRSFLDNNYSFRSYYKDAVAGQLGNVMLFGVTSKQPGFYFSYPIRDDGGVLVGVAVVKLNEALIEKSLISSGARKFGQVFAVDSDGVVLVSSRRDWIFRTLGAIPPERMSAIKEEKRFGDFPLTPLTYEDVIVAIKSYKKPVLLELFDGEESRNEILSVSKIGDYNYFLVTESGRDEMLVGLVRVSLSIAGLVFVVAAMALFLVVFLVKHFLAPLEQLAKLAVRLGGGDFSANFHFSTGDEIEELGKVFNTMTMKLRESHLKTRQGEERLAIEVEKLAREKAKDELILKSIGEGVVVLDENGKVLLVNPVAAKMFGMGITEMMDRPYFELWRVVDALGNEIVNRPIEQTLSSEKMILSGDYFYTRKDGSVFPVFLTVAPLIKDGKVAGVIVVFRDIAREKAADKAKTEFVSLASHQLRTPLSAANWYVEMLLSGDLGTIDPNQRKYLMEIYSANRRMVELVNSLLNVSRIDLGTFAVEPEDLSIEKITKSVIGDLKIQIESRKIRLIEEYDPKVPVIKADPQLMRMIVQNLLTNSIKYTPPQGEVDLEVKLMRAGDMVGERVVSDDSVLIRVADNGYGIPANQQDRIFTKLFRADNIRTRDTEGTGLGLYITKSVVDVANGSIWFDSKEDMGTTFYVLLPVSGMQKRSGTKQLSL